MAIKSALEFHDSEVVAVQMEENELHVVLEPAYIHRSAGRPGIDSGSGFLQSAEIVFTDAKFSEKEGPCSGPIEEGIVTVAGKRYNDMLPLPFTAVGAVSAEFTFESGSVLSINGAGINCFSKGQARFVEEY
jgi:hypothetical protein